MRKVLSVLLAVCMIMTTIPAYATELQDVNDGTEVEVTETEIGEVTEEATPSDAEYIFTSSNAEYDDNAEEDEIVIPSSSNAEYSGKDDIVLTVTAEDGIKVTLTADADAFEHYGELKLKVSVVELNDNEEDALDEKENENVAKRVTYDISVLDGDTIIEPSKDVDVKFELPDVPSGVDGINIYHHDTDGIEVIATEELDSASDNTATVVGETEKTTDIDLTDLSEEELAELDDVEIIDDVTVKATVDSFSKYTVDFTYNEIIASIPGGTNHNKLADVLAKVDITKGIVDAKAYQDADCTKLAVDGIVKDENGKELFKVYKENDVWYVDAINSFTSEHGLKVKTSDNAEYVIKVTDPAGGGSIVKFEMQGHGTAPDSQDLNIGDKVTKPADPTAIGYTFGGWYKEAKCKHAWDFDTDTVTGSTTLYAKWTSDEYTVTYNKNGATSGMTPSDGTKYSYNATVTVLGNTGPLVKTGYTFAGWNTKTDGSGTDYVEGSTFNITVDTTLYAKWTAKTSTVTLDGNGATTAGTASVTATYDSAMPSATMPTKTGYTFDGYCDATSGETQYYKADGSSAKNWDKEDATTTLYAKWTKNADPTPTPDPENKSSGGSGSSSVPTWSNPPVIYGTIESPVNYGEWIKTSAGYWQYQVNKDPYKNVMAWIEYYWTDNKYHKGFFYFDKLGNMQIGWTKIGDTWYYFEPNVGPEKGMMFKSTWIPYDGKQYYIGEDGKMLTNATTPDGHKVDAEGARID